MLPPGIFVWETGGAHVSPSSPECISEASSGWQRDIHTFGPWQEGLKSEGHAFFQGGQPVDETIVVTADCETTMTAARELVEDGLISEWGSVVAVEQSIGRGQLRRPWVSSPGNLHASVVMPAAPESGPWRDALPNLLPLVAGYVFMTVLGELGCELTMKWPNDLIQAGRKVGGMLIEEKNGVVILGLGVNLVSCPPDEMMREDCSVSAGVLQIQQGAATALTLWQSLVNRGKGVYRVLLDELYPSQFLSEAASRLAWLGQRVRVSDGGRDEFHAVIAGLSLTGGLVLEYEGRETILCSGSIFPI